MERLRFALLFNGRSLERWHLHCLDQLGEVAELTGVILAADEPDSRARSAGSRAMRSYTERVERRSIVDVTARFAHVPRISAETVRSSDEHPVLDFVLILGRVRSAPELGLDVRYGVWYFEHERDANLLPFFREVYAAEDVTRAALLALDGRPGEAAVLEEGYFRTEQRSYVASRDRVLDCIAAWPARVCRQLLAGVDADGRLRTMATVDLTARSDRRFRFLQFAAAMTRRRVGVAWERFFRHPQWNIGILKLPIGALVARGAYPDGDVEWLPLEDREGFFADPFGIVRDGRLSILCEYFGYRESRGHVYALEHTSDGFKRLAAPAMPLAGHVSYPFLLQSADDVYCVPETSDANEVAIFRAIEFPRRWAKVAVLLEDFAGVDPTVFSHDGRWWLTCTRKGPHEDVELWIWYAFDILGPWTPHEQNPVKSDVRGARPAGSPFVHDGVLYRPAQDCSRGYGGRIVLQRVTRLTPQAFREEPVAVLEASPESPFPGGPHSLAPVGDMVLVDGRRTIFVWAAFRAFLRIWASDLARKARRA